MSPRERATAIVDAWADEWTLVDSRTTAFKVGAYEALVKAVAAACEEPPELWDYVKPREP